MLEQMWNSHSLLMRMKNGTATVEDRRAVPYKTRHTLTLWSSSHAPWYLPNGLKTCPRENLHTDVYSSLLHNSRTWESTKIPPLREQINWYLWIMKYYSALERDEPSSHKTHVGNVNAYHWVTETHLRWLQTVWSNYTTFWRRQNSGDS